MKTHAANRFTIAILVVFSLSACSATPEVQLKSRQDQQLIQWHESVNRQELRINLTWTKPMFPGPHATIIIHPGIGESAQDQNHIAEELAHSGYLVVAVDYERRIGDSYETPTLPWRATHEEEKALEYIVANPLVDTDNMAALGYSLGGAHTLLMSSHSPLIKAVVVYYPMTDFESWVAERNDQFIWRMMFRFARWSYNAEADHHDDASHQALLRNYSAIQRSDKLNMPVLIIHGDVDNVAPLKHSQRLFDALRAKGDKAVDLMVLRGAGHAFDKKISNHSGRAWQATLRWFSQHLNEGGRIASREREPSML